MEVEIQLVLIVLDDGSIARKRFITRDSLGNRTEISDEAVEADIAKHAWANRVVSWKYATQDDFPADESYRNAWRMGADGRIKVDREPQSQLRVQRIKAEAQRRIIGLTGTPNLAQCLVKQANANMRANELNDKRISGEAFTPEEEAEADALRNLAVAIKAIRAASNTLEQAPPEDYTADKHWP